MENTAIPPQENPTIPPHANPFFKLTKPVLIGLGAIILLIAATFGSWFVISSNQGKTAPPITPTVTPTPDPTANWKTYIDSYFGASINYPPFLKLDSKASSGGDVVLSFPEGPEALSPAPEPTDLTVKRYLPSKIVITRLSTFGHRLTLDQITVLYKDYPSEPITTDGLNGLFFSLVTGPITGNSNSSKAFVIKDDNSYYFFDLIEGTQTSQVGDFSKQREIFKQILSTFKFLNEENQVACTQEAKLCPDGSYVSRQPPNCEFAACPGE